MTQPLNRNARIPAIGDVAEEQGEFWVDNPFLMPRMGENLSAYERNRIFLNHGGTDFIEISFITGGADIDSDSRSVMANDFDRDGKPDVLVGNIGGGPLRLFANRFSDANGRITLDLEGTQSNRMGIGARVIIKAGGKTIRRDMFAVNGFMGQAATELDIGVGPVQTIEWMLIQWPSGLDQEFQNLPVNKRITVTEGTAAPKIEEFHPLRAGA